ncbi:MAG: HD domain-containing protein [Nitrospirae bacterium]|nr:HD domain-containing protein [Nitrospirota bacterium]MCL5238760.1 HD domain-containing protein [Nitrospirota bacterium]
MKQSDLDLFKEWFSGYCKSFYSPIEEDQKNFLLKEHHTHQVCKNIVRIAAEQPLSRDELMIAEAIGLFHDIGRFPQYARYRTFRDSSSVNHGELGAQVLTENAVLRNIPERERHIITTAVKFHNTYKIPGIGDTEAILFLKLIRDADKLDIWRVFFEYYEERDDERPSAVGIGLPDVPGYSPAVLERILNKQLIPLTMLKTLNDFKLTKLSWMYDLNFGASLRIVLENDYIGKIIATLPQTDEIGRLADFLYEYIQERLEEGTHV